MKLSVTLATYYGDFDLVERCLDAVKSIADEIIIVYGKPTDKNQVENGTITTIAEKFRAKLITVPNDYNNFHHMKKLANDQAHGEWILQLDTDEIVDELLAKEIKMIINLDQANIEKYQLEIPNRQLLIRHQQLIEERGEISTIKEGPFVAYFIPRLNYFLGRYLVHGGVYPDGVIRLFRKDQAHLPAKSVHEQMVVDGRVGWMKNSLLHNNNPTFGVYIDKRFNHYTDIMARTITGGWWANMFWRPLFDSNQGFLSIYVRHLGFLDGFPGFIWALFSALHFPIAFFKSIDIHEGRVR